MMLYVLVLGASGLLAFIVWLWITARNAGGDAVSLEEEKIDAETARRIAAAGSKSPRDTAALVDRLRRGGGL